jgi:putative membrane protein
MLTLSDLPTLNATLNGISFAILLMGYYFVRQGKIIAHKTCMLSALAASILFLTSYLVYHYNVGSVRFTKEGWIRPVYFTILISHTVLAVAVVPLAVVTLYRAWKERFTRHVKIARWALPIWLYVSVTGVIIYLMLYRI